MPIDLVLCIVGFVLLYYGAEWLVRGSSDLARSLGVAPIVIGLTVVAFGTSAPELVVSLVSSLKGKSMIAVGNVFGSNICNIALVLGLAAYLQPITCARSVLRRDIPLMLLITVVTLLFCFDDRLGRIEGVILFVGIVLYTIMNYAFARRGDTESIEIPDIDAAGARLLGARDAILMIVCAAVAAPLLAFVVQDATGGILALSLLAAVVLALLAQEGLRLRAGHRSMMIVLVVVGIYGVVLGAQVVVDAAERIMYALGVDEKFVGLTLVAFGTSLPELATSVVAAMRREMDISIGNLVGSNVFNLLSVLGVAAMVNPITIPGGFVGSGLVYDGLIMLAISALPLFLMRRDATLGRRGGLVLLACYVGFLVLLVARA